MTITEGSRRDRRGSRIITKKLFSTDCHMLQRSFHAAENTYYSCVDATEFFRENERHKECLRRRGGFHQSLMKVTAHILAQVFHLQIYSLSNEYLCSKTLLQNNNKAMKEVNIPHKTPKYLVWFRSKKLSPSTSLPRWDFVTIHSSHMHLCMGAAEAGIPFCTSPCSNWLYAKCPEGWDAPEAGGGAPDVGGALNEPTNIRKKTLKYHKL